MNKPKKSDDKYWTGTRNFDDIQFISDLEDYIFYLEERIEALAITRVSHCACTPDETTGTTTIRCCNVCGKPAESFWHCG